MQCNEVKDWLTLYTGSELDPSEHTIVERHIQVCKYCLQEVKDYRILSNRLTQLKEEPVDETLWHDMWQNIQKNIRHQQEAKIALFPRFLQLAASLVIGIGIGCLGYLFLASTPEDEAKELDTVAKSALDDVHPAVMGVRTAPLDEKLIQTLKMPQKVNGAYVTRVVRGSLAEKAGIKTGDVILNYEYEPTQIATIQGQRHPSWKIKTKILRNGKIVEYELIPFVKSR